MREAQRLAEERHTEHPREGEVTKKEDCMALASAQEKQV
jgi:hypothetical protein